MPPPPHPSRFHPQNPQAPLHQFPFAAPSSYSDFGATALVFFVWICLFCTGKWIWRGWNALSSYVPAPPKLSSPRNCQKRPQLASFYELRNLRQLPYLITIITVFVTVKIGDIWVRIGIKEEHNSWDFARFRRICPHKKLPAKNPPPYIYFAIILRMLWCWGSVEDI